MVVKKKLKNYELVTSRTGFDMPFQVYGKNKEDALRNAKKKLRKGEKVLSLRRG